MRPNTQSLSSITGPIRDMKLTPQHLIFTYSSVVSVILNHTLITLIHTHTHTHQAQCREGTKGGFVQVLCAL